jgi:hypothetical protein
MSKKIVGKIYRAYDARTITISPIDAMVLLSTDDPQEAINYARERGATVTVYAYDRCEDGELINAIFVYHLATFVAK